MRIFLKIFMKTIFISISRGLVVRNLLRTDALGLLMKNKDIKIVFLVLDKAVEEFKKEFFGENIEIIPVASPKIGKIRSWVLKAVARNLVWTDSSKMLSFLGKFSDKKRNTFFYKIIFNTIGFLGKLKTAVRFYRWIEFYIFPEKNFDYLFKGRMIDLIFLPDIQGKIDTALLKSARRFGVKSVAMTKGWDTLCQRLLRALPDKFIAQSEPVKMDAIKYQYMPAEKIFLSGFPQFDSFFKKEWLLPREEYCKKMGFDPARAILFFGSSGAWTRHDNTTLRILCELVRNNQFVRPCSLVIRPHFSNVKYKPYQEFNGLKDVCVDDKYTLSDFIDNWNPSDEDTKMLINTLYHSSVLICYFSTLVLDASAIDKPIINLVFGGQYDIDGKDVTQRLFRRTHYQPIVKSGGVRMVHNPEELVQSIDRYLQNPELDIEGRRIIKDRWCFGADGLAGKRAGEFLLKELNIEYER